MASRGVNRTDGLLVGLVCVGVKGFDAASPTTIVIPLSIVSNMIITNHVKHGNPSANRHITNGGITSVKCNTRHSVPTYNLLKATTVPLSNGKHIL